jgi:hypothetical protein
MPRDSWLMDRGNIQPGRNSCSGFSPVSPIG